MKIVYRTVTPLILLFAGFLGSMTSFGEQGRAQQVIDISGPWRISVRGDFELKCSATFAQTGSRLSTPLDCEGLTGTFTGSIDTASGNFSIAGTVLIAPVEAQGTVSADQQTISGTWEALDYLRGTFTGTRASSTTRGVDLSGTWELEFVGGDACTATIGQSGGDFSGILQCPGAAPAELTGTTGDPSFQLAVSVSGAPGQIAGSMSRDGFAIVGGWEPSSGGPARTVLGVKQRDGTQVFDLTGQWSTALRGSFPLTCASAIEQAGTKLDVLADCGVIQTLLLSGAINHETGTFRLSEGPPQAVTLLGVVLADGSIAGAWLAPFGGLTLAGTLVSRRVSDTPQLIDLSGEWDLGFAGNREGMCRARIEQAPTALQASVSLTAVVDCGPATSGIFEGAVGSLAGHVALQGALAGLELTLRGDVLDGSDSFEGVWDVHHERPVDVSDPEAFEDAYSDFGCFVARRSGSTQRLACTPPRTHPNIIAECWGGCRQPQEEQVPEQPLALGGSSTASEKAPIGALAGLAAGLVALGLWRFRLHA